MVHSGQYLDLNRGVSHPSICFPAEIWNLVLSYANTKSLTVTVRSSRLLFDLTIPYLWRDVNITTVLALLPGSSPEYPQDPGAFEVQGCS